jgi:RimJ/RimL family protein N-acetyltransferase
MFHKVSVLPALRVGARMARQIADPNPEENSVENRRPDPARGDVVLRDVIDDDLAIFFDQRLDPDANYMAAFTAEDPADRAAFMAHWKKILGDDTIIKNTILFDGQVAGDIASFEMFGERVVGYWIGRQYWGKGIATRALAAFLGLVKGRPLFARVAKDNVASLRVLQKCGFTITGEDKGFANARGNEIEEYLLTLAPNDAH